MCLVRNGKRNTQKRNIGDKLRKQLFQKLLPQYWPLTFLSLHALFDMARKSRVSFLSRLIFHVDREQRIHSSNITVHAASRSLTHRPSPLRLLSPTGHMQ